jgi:hypothetical protein
MKTLDRDNEKETDLMRTFALCLALLAVALGTHGTAQNHVNGYAAATTSGRVI